ncbi:hypothetical protein OKW21_002086 [Catalinimonas alkaloidigena]|uniref:hypothetical protein n=1 Tax=Catalinimonas alkaloidigena TaxID=1075417 RepID=UPI0024073A64|nr:hypothetical protein [Catalinimonas alkaloidigena]MDF9796823.1 hypothetical protein [Catalinimonas alkaloidigena]
MRQTIVQKMSRMSTAIDNSMKYPEILAALKKVGYNQQMILAGKASLEEFRMLHESQSQKYGDQFEVGKAFKEDIKQAKQIHATHRKLAKIAYASDISMYTRLGLGKFETAVDSWLNYAENFYNVLIKDSSTLQEYGVSEEEVAQTLASIQALFDARHKHFACKGEAQHATHKRNEAMRKMDAWMSDFKKAARFALRDEPELLEVLGIFVRTHV